MSTISSVIISFALGAGTVSFAQIDEHVALCGYCIEPGDLFELCVDLLVVGGPTAWSGE